MQMQVKRLRMVRLRLNDEEFAQLMKEKRDTGASLSSIIRDALAMRRGCMKTSEAPKPLCSAGT